MHFFLQLSCCVTQVHFANTDKHQRPRERTFWWDQHIGMSLLHNTGLSSNVIGGTCDFVGKPNTRDSID